MIARRLRGMLNLPLRPVAWRIVPPASRTNTSNGPQALCVRTLEPIALPLIHSGVEFPDVAAARTTMSTTGAFLLAMIMHPEIQAKAQAELDRETGGDRLPTLAE